MNNKHTKDKSVRDLIQVIEKESETPPQNEKKPTNNSNIIKIKKKRTNVLDTAKLAPTPVLLIIDNFYNNPMETRKFILQQDFRIRGNYPGPRTICFATPEIRDMIQKFILFKYGFKVC